MGTPTQTHEYNTPTIVLLGPTAIGKTDLSLEIARTFGCEIISLDSMQVYRYMDVGTAKVSPTEREAVPHHLIDIVDPDEHYHAARFVRDCRQVLKEIEERGAIPLITGGTGLYLQALKQGLAPIPETDKVVHRSLKKRLAQEGSQHLHAELVKVDKEYAARIHSNDQLRIIRALEVYQTTGTPLSEHLKMHASETVSPVFGRLFTCALTCCREQLYERINTRTRNMLSLGLEAEVKSLLKKGYPATLKSMQAIGYRHMINYINDVWTEGELLENLARDTRRYAKRQYTWFNKDQSIQWYNRSDSDHLLRDIKTFLCARL